MGSGRAAFGLRLNENGQWKKEGGQELWGKPRGSDGVGEATRVSSAKAGALRFMGAAAEMRIPREAEPMGESQSSLLWLTGNDGGPASPAWNQSCHPSLSQETYT